MTLETGDRLYLLHLGFPLDSPLTENEVRCTRVACNTCAQVVHLTDNTYRTVRSGHMTCTTDKVTTHLNLTAGTTLTMTKDTSCSNTLLTWGLQNIRMTTYLIDTTGEKAIDAMLLKKQVEHPDKELETLQHIHDTHTALNQKLRLDVELANRDLDNFIVATQTKDTFHGTALSTMAIVLIVVAIIVLVIVGLVIRQMAIRKIRQFGPLPDIAMGHLHHNDDE
jgi:hypothetical protein